MGRQFSFFLGPADQKPFDETIRAAGDVVYFKSRPTTATAEEVLTSVLPEYGKDELQLLMARRDDIPRLKFEPIRGRNEFSCDQNSNNIVELSRCYVNDKYISVGRMYLVASYFDSANSLIRKPPEFLTWAEHIYKRAKRSLTHLGQGFYAGAEALKLQKDGIELKYF